MKKVYVGNLSYETSEQDLIQLFSDFGEVSSANIIRDKFNDSSKGFGFVEMADDDQADAAIDQLNGVEFQGRTLKVNEAREKREGDRPQGGRPPRSGGSGGHRGGGSRYGDNDRRGGGGSGFRSSDRGGRGGDRHGGSGDRRNNSRGNNDRGGNKY